MIYTCRKSDLAYVAAFKESLGQTRPLDMHFITWYGILARRLERLCFIARQCATLPYERDIIEEMKVQVLFILREEKVRGRKDKFIDFAMGIDITPTKAVDYVKGAIMSPLARLIEESDMFCAEIGVL